MAAGLGFKTFTTGEVLTAADTNGYLMQGVLVFASSAARSAAVTSPQEGQYSYLKDTNSTEYYDGAAWIAAPIGDITGVTAGTGISGGGTSGTVTVTNSMATEITAAGDIIVGTGSGTFDNLPIGTTAQVLTADTTVSPYKVKWATPAPSALTLIQRSTFTSVATTTTTFDSIFTSTYRSYMIVIENIGSSTAGAGILFQWRYAGPTTQSASYYGGSIAGNPGGASTVPASASNISQLTICAQSGTSSTRGNMNIQGVGNASENPTINFQITDTYGGLTINGGGWNNTARTYTGFILAASAGNLTGTITIYGLATA